MNGEGLTPEDWMHIELAVEAHIQELRNRFEEDPRYVHPAIAYEKLLTKLTNDTDGN